MKKEDMPILRQLVQTLEEVEEKLEEAYKKKNADKFNNSKKIMLKVQNQISKMLK